MIFFKNSSHAEYEKIFYDFKINSITGDQIDLKDFKGKPILIVNTASYCGFTKQYNDMQELWEKYRDRGLIVLGVPSNSFNQEKSDNSAVKEFCEVNFNINFPLTEITDVRGDNAHEIYKWAKENYGKSIICGYARIDGWAVGIVANQREMIKDSRNLEVYLKN